MNDDEPSEDLLLKIEFFMNELTKMINSLEHITNENVYE